MTTRLQKLFADAGLGSRRTVEPGTYEVVLEVDGTSMTRPVVVRPPVHIRRGD